MTGRSHLFVPGDKPAMLTKAPSRGADALIIDLEDAVAPSAKVAARGVVRSHLDELGASGNPVWLRVNNTPDLLEGDLALAEHEAVSGIVLPKVDDPAEPVAVGRELERLGRPGLPVDAMIETGRALLAAEAIAAVPGVVRLTLGLGDLGADLAVDAGPDDELWAPIRLQIVVVSAAHELERPIAPVSPNFRDLELYEATSRRWATAGYGGRQAIHPSQVPVLNEVFGPSPAAVAEARRIVELFDRALADGTGAIIDTDGTMIDEAFVRRARAILDVARDQASAE